MKSRLLYAIAVIVIAAGVQAQATRTWVSGVGDDANPCSRTAPCKTFAGAISKTATGGEIDVLDPGGFGAINITKSITIDGGPFAGGILAAGTNGALINAGATGKVILRNLNIFGANTGISGVKVNTALEVHIDNCDIWGFQRGIEYINTQSGATLAVVDSTIRNNSNTGISVIPGAAVATRVLVDNTKVVKNVGDAILLFGGTTAHIRNSTVWGHGSNQGFNISEVSGQTTDVTIEGCTIGNNQNGIFVGGTGASAVRVSGTTITANTANGINLSGSHLVQSFGNNSLDGNPAGNAFSPGLIGPD